jgi:hypothetical protein
VANLINFTSGNKHFIIHNMHLMFELTGKVAARGATVGSVLKMVGI